MFPNDPSNDQNRLKASLILQLFQCNIEKRMGELYLPKATVSQVKIDYISNFLVKFSILSRKTIHQKMLK